MKYQIDYVNFSNVKFVPVVPVIPVKYTKKSYTNYTSCLSFLPFRGCINIFHKITFVKICSMFSFRNNMVNLVNKHYKYEVYM